MKTRLSGKTGNPSFFNIPGINDYSHELLFWRKRICDAVYYFMIAFGMVAYVPSFIASWKGGYFNIIVINTLVYIIAIVLAFNKKIPYILRGLFGSLAFFFLGVYLFIVVGPSGAGIIWMFGSTMIAAFLLGNSGAVIVFILNVIAQFVFYFLLRATLLPWQADSLITAQAWIIKGSNYIVLNGLIVLTNYIFLKGFSVLLDRSRETRNATIIGLADLAEHRDTATGDHLYRIQKYVGILAEELSRKDKFSRYITRSYREDLQISSILHDIGKVGVPDSILLKPGKLTSTEFDIIKMHPEIGSEVIHGIENKIKGRSLYNLGIEVALYHHEKWDGSGYPKGLAGEAIPLSARITALADVYDALRSKRPYKEAFSHEQTRDIIKEGRGCHFDPDVVDAFLEVEDRFAALSGV